MKFYDRDLNLTQGYWRWQKYLIRNPDVANSLDGIKIQLVQLRDYIDMHNNFTLDQFISNSVQFHIDFLLLEDPHNYPVVPEFVNNYPIKTFILHNDFSIDNSTEPNRLYYPVWLFFVQDKTEKVSDVVTEHALSCANRNICYRPGKIYNYQTLKNKNYFNKILFTKYKIESNLDCHWPRPYDAEFEKVFRELETDYANWPTIDHDLFEAMAALNLPVYTKSLFHMVAESGVKENLISEKTYKIFHVKQIPILCGAKNAMAHLRDLGFDIFDDLIDHNKYDSVDDFKRRIDAMQDTAESIFSYDHTVLLAQTLDRRNKNYTRLHSNSLSDLISKSIVDRFIIEKNINT